MTRIFEPRDEKTQRLVHGAFRATLVRSGEPITCRFCADSGQPSLEARMWQLSPLGAEIRLALSEAPHLGQSVRLNLKIATQSAVHEAKIVYAKDLGHSTYHLGLRFSPSSTRASQASASVLRSLTRWSSHPLFYPTGSFDNVARFNDKVLFRVKDLCAQGMRITTSLRNKFLLPGFTVQGTLTFPQSSPLTFKAKIVSSEIDTDAGSSFHTLGLQFIHLSSGGTRLIAQYIMHYGSHGSKTPSPQLLKNEGYPPTDMAGAVDWDYVQSEEEYRQVLQLRSDAFRSVQGLGVVKDADGMADSFDARSRIIIARFRNRIIGTVRICFHTKDDLFEEEQYVTLPNDLPPRHLIVEASRAATHPEYRNTDLFMNMMRFTMLTVLQSGRRWLLQSTYEDLVPIYKRIGFVDLGVKVPHQVFPGKNLILLLADAQAVASAQIHNLFLHHSLVPHIEKLLRSDHFAHLNWRQRQKIKAFKRLSPVFKAYTRYMRIKKNLKSRFT